MGTRTAYICTVCAMKQYNIYVQCTKISELQFTRWYTDSVQNRKSIKQTFLYIAKYDVISGRMFVGGEQLVPLGERRATLQRVQQRALHIQPGPGATRDQERV
jgi:hypothetical protein